MTAVIAPPSAFRLPDAGEGLTEAEIVRWLVAPGDRVVVNQPVVEIETAKSVVELPSPFDGVVEAIVAAEGALVPVGDPILLVRPPAPSAGAAHPAPSADAAHPAPSADAVGPAPSAGAAGPAPSAGAAQPVRPGGAARPVPPATPAVLVGYGPAGTPDRAGRGGPGVPPETGAPSETRVPPGSDGAAGRVRAKPPVRALARQLGIGLDTIRPSGPDQTVTREDVRRAASDKSRGDAERVTRQPIRSVRRATAAAMVESAFSAPHASLFIETDATKGLKFARRTGLGLLSLAAFALVRAAKRHPVINASWDQAGGQIVYHHYVNLGLAVDSPRGLLVPCLADADRLSLPELAGAIRRLVEVAREGTTTPAAMRGGTITLTNVGALGVDGGSPILVPGQVAILALGAIRTRPWAHKGKIRLRSVGRLTLTFDHRLIDGADAAEAVKSVAAVLERPDSALT